MAKMDTKGDVAGERPGGRRRHWPVELKQQIVRESLEPGTSVSVVARRHDVNANQVFTWRRHQRDGLLGEEQTVPLMAVRVSAESAAPVSSAEIRPGLIEIELPGGIRLRVHGVVEAAALRQVLTALRVR